MSVRTFSLFEPPKPRAPGSIFGTAIPAPSCGFWKRLAVSPPRTPPTEARKYAPLPPEFHLEGPCLTAPTSVQLDAVLPTWLHRFDDAVLVTFHQAPGVTTLRASPRLECTNMVHATKVCADSAGWRPLACNEPGKAGHLTQRDGHVEVHQRVAHGRAADTAATAVDRRLRRRRRRARARMFGLYFLFIAQELFRNYA